MTVGARRVIVLLLLLAVAAAGCGSSAQAGPPGRVKVFFCNAVSMPSCRADASRAQELAVGRALRQTPHVVKIAYVSKAVGLRNFKKSNPGFPTKTLPANPLPDSWVVTVDSVDNDAAVGKAICAAHYAGVQPCRAPGEWGGVVWSTLKPRLP